MREAQQQRALPPGTAWAAMVFLVLTCLLWISLFTSGRFGDRDAYDYAQIGRQIRRGHGFTTRQIFPRHIPYMDEKGLLDGDEWPSLYRYPLPPLMNAAVQVVIGDVVTAAVVQSGIWFLLGVPVFVAFAARLTDLRAACLAGVLLIGDPRIWVGSFNGMTETLALLVQLAVFSIAFAPGAAAGRRCNWLVLGLLCGVGYLVRTQLLILLPLAVLFVLFAVKSRRRLWSLVLLFSGALLGVFPWLLRNWLVSGNPLFAFTNTRNLLAKTQFHHRIDLVLDAPVAAGEVLQRYGGEIAAKIWHHLWPNVVDPRFWFTVLGWYSMVFAIVGTVYAVALVRGRKLAAGPVSGPYAMFEVAVVVLILGNFAMISMIYHRVRYYDTLIPFIIIIISYRVVLLFDFLLQKRSQSRAVGLSVLAVLMLAAGVRLAHTCSNHVGVHRVSEVEAAACRAVCELVDEDAVVASDMSAQITLLCGNRTVRLPSDPEDVLVIDAHYLALDYVLIGAAYFPSRYRPFSRSQAFQARFKSCAELENGARLYRRRETAESRLGGSESGE